MEAEARAGTPAGRLLLLAVLLLGVFLAGLELMVTAVALPSIIADPSVTDWRELRRASWIVNGYLVAYVTAMPLAGRASDRFGTRRPLLVALGLFVVGSVGAGLAQGLEWLVGARLVQGLGGGALVPLATAAAGHLFGPRGRPRALGLVGALTFLGMAAGPFAGAAILEAARFESALRATGIAADVTRFLVPAWRWVFYLNVPFALLALLYAWAIGIDTPRGRGRVDLVGAGLFAGGLAAGLAAITWSGAPEMAGGSAGTVALGLLAVAALALAAARASRVGGPLLDPRSLRDPVYASALLISLLTGYGFATAILGGAVFVDRVIYGGPETQRVALGVLAGATAAGALASGFVVRRLSPRVAALAGLALSAVALWRMAGWDTAVDVGRLAADLAVFGFGFGATVTPRSTAAVEALGKAAYGTASAAVTVARLVGMAIGLAVLTELGSSRIAALARIIDDPALRDRILPPGLRGLPLENPLVVTVLENWAAAEAAQILTLVFVAALGVTIGAVIPAWALGSGGQSRAMAEGDRSPAVAL